jgi:hypothetical protein
MGRYPIGIGLVDFPEADVASARLGHSPATPFELSRWRGGRYRVRLSRHL